MLCYYYYYVYFLISDPKIKATVRKHLLSVSGNEIDNRPINIDYHHRPLVNSIATSNRTRPGPGVHQSHVFRHNTTLSTTLATNGSCPPEQEPLLEHDNEENERLQWEPLAANDNKTKGKPKFEAYMMTGEHILNISRMPQTTTIIPKQQKKVF